MSHLRSAFSGVSVPVGSDNSSHQITNNNNVTVEIKKKEKEGVEEVSEGVYVVYPPKGFAERDLESAEKRLNEIKSQIPEDKQLVEALSLIVDILYNNPLYQNRFVICEKESLCKLIQILTGAKEVNITITDPACDCGCCTVSSVVISAIDSIYVLDEEDTLKEFRYCYPQAKVLLENNHISTKFIQLPSA